MNQSFSCDMYTNDFDSKFNRFDMTCKLTKWLTSSVSSSRNEGAGYLGRQRAFRRFSILNISDIFRHCDKDDSIYPNILKIQIPHVVQILQFSWDGIWYLLIMPLYNPQTCQSIIKVFVKFTFLNFLPQRQNVIWKRYKILNASKFHKSTNTLTRFANFS